MLRIEGYDPDAYGEHQRVPHWDIGTELGILDGERAAKISGSMFMLYRGWGARLLRAMVQLSLDRNADAYEELRPPTLVRTDTMIATGHLPKFEDEAYHMERDDLWAIPTAEVPLTSLHRDEVLAEADLPAALHRAHVVLPAGGRRGRARHARAAARPRVRQGRAPRAWPPDAEQAIACQEDILARSEALLAELGLPYRVLDLCTGDVGASAARTWDLEAYAPGCDMWLEVSSVSWFSDYQARRANIRYRPSRRQGHRGVPHRERLGHGLAAHGRRLPRDAPPARRLDRDRRSRSRATSAIEAIPAGLADPRLGNVPAARRRVRARRERACRSSGPGSASTSASAPASCRSSAWSSPSCSAPASPSSSSPPARTAT